MEESVPTVNDDSGSEKDGDTVVIAMDGSEYSDYALQCKSYFLHWSTANIFAGLPLFLSI